MSGRSAYVRNRKPKTVEQTLTPAYEASTRRSYGLDDEEVPRSANYPQPSYFTQSPTIEQGQSISSGGTPYGYLIQPPGKPKSTVIAPIIEKSEFRTHMDGMTATVRGKLGKLMKVGDNSGNSAQRKSRRKSVGSDCSGRVTPSLTEPPSLLASISPSERPRTFPNQNTLTTIPSGSGQEQNGVIIRFKKFIGDGKPPSRNWHIRVSHHHV